MYQHEEEVKKILVKLEQAKIDLKGKHIIVTGGAGFLGSWVCDVLLAQNAKVVCIDNLSSGQWKNVSHHKDNPNFIFIRHDISEPICFGKTVPNQISFPNITQKFDYIMHMASRASPFEFEHYPIEILKSNTIGTMNSLNLALEHNAIFFYTSTSETYGNPTKDHVPTPESYFGNVNPIGPRSCYDESKRTGETFTMAYHNKYGVDVHFIRIFNTYGGRIRGGPKFGRVIPNFIEQCLKNEPITVFGDGSQTRSFTYVADEIEGIIKDMCTPEANGFPINVGNDNMMTVLELAELIKKLTNSQSEIIFKNLPKDDPLLRQPILDKARKILHWEPSTDVKEGLLKTIEWFKEENNI